MLDELGNIVGVYCVLYVIEVLTVGIFTIGVLVSEVLVDVLVILDLVPNLADTKFLVLWH